MSEDVIVLGSGPGGYTSALLSAKEGLDVTLVEKSGIGGVCTNQGCIPSKALLSIAENIDSISNSRRRGISSKIDDIDMEKVQNIKQRAIISSRKGIEKQLEDYGIEIVRGGGKIVGQHEVEVDGKTFQGDNIIVATGSEPIVLPFLDVDGKNIFTSKGALNLREIPESMLIIGGGYIGVELAYVYSSLGTAVTVVELLDRLLPVMDQDLGPVAEKILKRKRVKIHKASEVTSVEGEGPFNIQVEGETTKEIESEKILCAVGRRPSPPETDLDITDDKGFIQVDERMKTSIDNVYAIGDVNGKTMLAHAAYKQAEIAVEDMIGNEPKEYSDYVIPSGVYIHPEIASVGLKEEDARDKYDSVRTAQFPISSTGRGYSTGERTGFAKIVAADDKILGLHLICPSATDIVMEGTVAIEAGLTVSRLKDIIHPHPTYSEVLKKAAEELL